MCCENSVFFVDICVFLYELYKIYFFCCGCGVFKECVFVKEYFVGEILILVLY